MAIQESIEFVDGASAPLNAAADAASDLASAADDARDAMSGAWGAESIEDASSAIEDVTSGAEDAADAIGEVEDAAADAGDTGSSAFESIGEAFQSINAGLEIAKKAGQALVKVAELGAKFAGAVIEAHRFNEAAEAALDAVTGGRGDEALERMTILAGNLGTTTEDVVGQFTALRDAGAGNADAEALIKLRADLAAVGVGAGEADAAVTEALDRIKAGGDPAAAIRDVASGFGAVGDGANAAARRALTFSGALDNARGVGARAFEAIAGSAGPALDALGAKITEVLDSFEESGAAAEFGNMLAGALEALPPIIDSMMEAWDSFSAAIEPSLARLGAAFDMLSATLGDAEGGMSTGAVVGEVLAVAFGMVVDTLTGVVAAAGLFIGAVNFIIDGATMIVDTITGIPDAIASIDLAAVGSNLVQSFVDGMLSMVGAVIDSASSIGDAAGGAIKSALGIASPSKVGLELGGNLGESVGTGVEDAMPPTIEPPAFADLPTPPAANTGARSAAPSDAPPVIVNITVESGATADAPELARLVRREIDAAWRERRTA